MIHIIINQQHGVPGSGVSSSLPVVANTFPFAVVQQADGGGNYLIARFNTDLRDKNGDLLWGGNGSSTMYGTGSNPTFGVGAMSFMEKLNTALDINATTITMWNLGVPGQWSEKWLPTGGVIDTDHNIAKLMQVGIGSPVKRYPQFVLLHDASNWVTNGVSNAQELINLQTIIDYAKQYGCTVFLIAPNPRGSYTTLQKQQLSDMNDLLKANFVTVKVPGVFYVPSFDFFKNGPTDYSIKPAYQGPEGEASDGTHFNNAGHEEMKNQVGAVIDAAYTVDATIVRHEIQIADSSGGPWSDYNTSIAGNLGYLIIPNSNAGKWFRHRAIKTTSQTAWSNPVSVKTLTGNAAPTAVAGSDQSITLPTSSVTLNSTGSTDSDGSIVSYAWSYLSGPGGASITTPTASTTNVTGLVAGTHVIRLTVTDNLGATGTDDVQITVSAASGGINPTGKIYVDLGGSSAGFGFDVTSPDSNGNYWNPMPGPFSAGYTVSNLVNEDNAATTVDVQWTNVTWGGTGSPGVNNAGTNADTGLYPANAVRDSALLDSGTTADGRITFTGLDPAQTHSIKLWGNRAAGGPRSLQFKLSSAGWAAPDIYEYDATVLAFDNGTQTITGITGVSSVQIDTRIKAGNVVGFAYIGIIEITIS